MPALFLHADDPFWRPQRAAALVALLADLGLLGDRWDCDGPVRYLAGHSFLQLLMFLGWSPQVALVPGEGGSGAAVCFVRVHIFEEPVLLSARPPPAVRCAQCRARASLPATFSCNTPLRCSSCGAKANAADLDWRQGAGWGCFFIEVDGVYPHEAIPSDKLLEALTGFAGCAWKYFYADTPL
jgi:hypothetical protein